MNVVSYRLVEVVRIRRPEKSHILNRRVKDNERDRCKSVLPCLAIR